MGKYHGVHGGFRVRSVLYSWHSFRKKSAKRLVLDILYIQIKT